MHVDVQGQQSDGNRTIRWLNDSALKAMPEWSLLTPEMVDSSVLEDVRRSSDFSPMFEGHQGTVCSSGHFH